LGDLDPVRELPAILLTGPAPYAARAQDQIRIHTGKELRRRIEAAAVRVHLKHSVWCKQAILIALEKAEAAAARDIDLEPQQLAPCFGPRRQMH